MTNIFNVAFDDDVLLIYFYKNVMCIKFKIATSLFFSVLSFKLIARSEEVAEGIIVANLYHIMRY